MEWEIIWGGDPEDVLLRTSGVASLEDLDAMLQALLADGRFRHRMKILADHTQANWNTLSGADVRRRAERIGEDEDRLGPQTVAFVVAAMADFGVGRMFQSFTEPRTQVQARVFDALEPAREWLRTVEG